MGTRQELGILLLALFLAAPLLGFFFNPPAPARVSAACSGATSSMSGTQRLMCGLKIGLNSATAADLEAIPGIGPTLAKRILEERERRGRFEEVDDLLDVKGIGSKRIERLRLFVDADQPPNALR